MAENILERVEVMNTPLTVFESYEHAGRSIVEDLFRQRKVSCVAVNPIKVCMARKDKQLQSMIRLADFCLCDGVGMAIAARLLLGRRIHRITGIKLFFDLVARAETCGLKIFLLGASPQSNRRADERLKRLHPRLQVVGRCHGYFRDSHEVIRQINESNADLLFIAMGSPRQESWLAEHRDGINARFCMGVGGSFDVLAGTVKRAPAAFQTTGTEWLYRLVTDPRRLRSQILLPLFALSLIREYVAKNLERLLQRSARIFSRVSQALQWRSADRTGAERMPTGTTESIAASVRESRPDSGKTVSARPTRVKSWHVASRLPDEKSAMVPPK